MFILSRKACLLARTSPNTFSGCILHKTKRSQNFKVSTKTMDPLQKCQFCGFLKPMFFLFRKACLLYKTSKIVFWRSIFTIYGMGIRGGYKGLQGVTKDYRNFLLTRNSQILFIGLFSIKIKVEEISNFWSKRWTNPFGKNSNFAFCVHRCFYSL